MTHASDPSLFPEADAPAPSPVGYASVAVEQGLDAAAGGLTYAVPPWLGDLAVGERVRVPLGRGDKPTPGYVIELSDQCPLPAERRGRIKPIRERDPRAIRLPADLIRLGRWLAGYYCCPPGMVFATMLPAAVKHGTGVSTQTWVRAAEEDRDRGTEGPRDQGGDARGARGVEAAGFNHDTAPPIPDAPYPEPGARHPEADPRHPEADPRHPEPETRDPEADPRDTGPEARDPKLSKLQRAALDEALRLAAAGEPWIEMPPLAARAGAKSIEPIKQLLAKGLLASKRVERVVSDLDARAEQTDAEPTPPPEGLTDGQQRAIDHLARHAHEGFSVHLLHGVTGSGKTEVYLRLLEKVVGERDRGTEGPRDQGGKSGRVAEWPSGQAGEGPRNPGTEGPIGTANATGQQPAAGSAHQQSAISNQQSPPTHQPSAIRHPPFPAAIVLVPEIALTPQTVARFLGRFAGVAVLHSGLTAAQRHAQWRRIQRGEATIVVGARSAVFAPVRNLAMVIVDEEHESSYKQDQLPRYHARDVAIKRAQLWDAPVILGSATPSLESFHNAGGGRPGTAGGRRSSGQVAESTEQAHDAQTDHPITRSPDHPRSGTRRPEPDIRGAKGHYHLIRMPDRVAAMKLPEVERVDMQAERRARRGLHLMSGRLEHALGHVFDAQTDGGRGQAILLLNRRGYANYIACPDHRCGWLLRCDHCDAAMVYHKGDHLPAGGLVRCHHCTAEQRLPRQCPVCHKRVTVFGHGTQRVEEELTKKFPGVSYLRMDSDTMRTGRDYATTLARFRAGEAEVLLGTQMIAKGLDFSGVRLVGVISGDTALHMPDFRAAERTFQLIAQVAGRAGRSERPGRVIVQTLQPEDPAITAAANHDYEGFAQRELALRHEMGLPPTTRMARLVVRDPDHAAAQNRARTLFTHLQHYNASLEAPVRLREPAPCPIARIADYFRFQIEMIGPAPGMLQKLLTALRHDRLLVSDMHTAVDVDPVALL